MAIPSNMFSTTGQPQTAADYALLKAGYNGSFQGNDAQSWFSQKMASNPKGYMGTGWNFEGVFNNELKKMQATALNDSGDSGGFSKLYGSNDPFGSATRYDYNPTMGSGGTYIPGQSASFDAYKQPEKAPYQPALYAAMQAGHPADPVHQAPAAMTASGASQATVDAARAAAGLPPIPPQATAGAPQAAAQTPAGATPPGGSGGSPPGGSAVAGSTPSGIAWNQQTATEIGRYYGLLGPNEVATGGLLDSRIASADPSLKNQITQLRSMIEGGSSADDLLGFMSNNQTENTDPSYGSLAKPAFKEFKPFQLSDFMASPDYNFRLQEGNKAIDRAQSARGGFFSGAALKAATEYGSNLAKGEYGDAYNRYNNDFGIGYSQAKGDSDTLYSRLAGISNQGMGATNTSVNNNQNNANALSGIYSATGQNQANGIVANSNTLNDTLASILNIGKTSSYTNPGAYSAGKAASNAARYY